MLKPTDIRVGNLIQYDHDEYRQPPYCSMRGFVKEIHTDYVVLTNGEKRKWERTEGLPIDVDLLEKFGFVRDRNGWFDPKTNFSLTEKYYPCWFDKMLWPQSMPDFNHVSLKEVHKLQNLYYWLNTIELEITVPESHH